MTGFAIRLFIYFYKLTIGAHGIFFFASKMMKNNNCFN